MTEYYITLGIPFGSSQERIKKAFRELSKLYHPDKPTGDTERYKKITEAYSELMKQSTSGSNIFKSYTKNQTQAKSTVNTFNEKMEILSKIKEKEETVRKLEQEIRRLKAKFILL